MNLLNIFPYRERGPILCDLLGPLYIRDEENNPLKIHVFGFFGGDRFSNKNLRCQYKSYIGDNLSEEMSEIMHKELLKKIIYPGDELEKKSTKPKKKTTTPKKRERKKRHGKTVSESNS